MQIEPLPKVTFLPMELTELVIKNWTGETIDLEKNGQVSALDGSIEPKRGTAREQFSRFESGFVAGQVSLAGRLWRNAEVQRQGGRRCSGS